MRERNRLLNLGHHAGNEGHISRKIRHGLPMVLFSPFSEEEKRVGDVATPINESNNELL
jgi:hypothetical protein